MKRTVLTSIFMLTMTCLLNAQLIEYSELKDQKAVKSLEDAMANPSEVIRLELKGDKIHNLGPDFAKLVNLQYLDLSRNEIAEFPIVLTKLEKLQHLDLGQNSITKIPDEIGQMQNLKYLCLNRNRLYVISPEIGKLKKMEEFDLYDNPIKTFPEEMREMTNLKELDLRVIELKEEEKKKLQKYFREAKIRFSRTCDCN